MNGFKAKAMGSACNTVLQHLSIGCPMLAMGCLCNTGSASLCFKSSVPQFLCLYNRGNVQTTPALQYYWKDTMGVDYRNLENVTLKYGQPPQSQPFNNAVLDASEMTQEHVTTAHFKYAVFSCSLMSLH